MNRYWKEYQKKLIIKGILEGKDYICRGRTRLECIQQMIKDQTCDSYVETRNEKEADAIEQ